jgi:hypothetical protein
MEDIDKLHTILEFVAADEGPWIAFQEEMLTFMSQSTGRRYHYLQLLVYIVLPRLYCSEVDVRHKVMYVNRMSYKEDILYQIETLVYNSSQSDAIAELYNHCMELSESHTLDFSRG